MNKLFLFGFCTTCLVSVCVCVCVCVCVSVHSVAEDLPVWCVCCSWCCESGRWQTPPITRLFHNTRVAPHHCRQDEEPPHEAAKRNDAGNKYKIDIYMFDNSGWSYQCPREQHALNVKLRWKSTFGSDNVLFYSFCSVPTLWLICPFVTSVCSLIFAPSLFGLIYLYTSTTYMQTNSSKDEIKLHSQV